MLCMFNIICAEIDFVVRKVSIYPIYSSISISWILLTFVFFQPFCKSSIFNRANRLLCWFKQILPNVCISLIVDLTNNVFSSFFFLFIHEIHNSPLFWSQHKCKNEQNGFSAPFVLALEWSSFVSVCRFYDGHILLLGLESQSGLSNRFGVDNVFFPLYHTSHLMDIGYSATF